MQEGGGGWPRARSMPTAHVQAASCTWTFRELELSPPRFAQKLASSSWRRGFRRRRTGQGRGRSSRPAASGCWHRLESRVLFAEAGSPRSQIWIQERLRVSKVKEGCKEMSCAAFIRELIWKEIECEPAARLSAPGPRGREAQPAPPGLAKAKAQPGAAS